MSTTAQQASPQQAPDHRTYYRQVPAPQIIASVTGTPYRARRGYTGTHHLHLGR